jgi:hypothetical protein
MGELMTRTLPEEYRKELSGAELAYEISLLLGKLQPGETLVIPQRLIARTPESFRGQPPRYPHTITERVDTMDITVRRDQ